MRSLFFISPSLHNHPRSNRPTAARNVPSPASCTHAPLPSAAFRHPPAPRSRAYLDPAHYHPLPGRPPCRPPSLPRAAARSHRTPSPEYRPAAARAHWIRLARIAPTACRRPHRIYPTACRHPHPSMSPPSRSRIVVQVVVIGKSRPHRPHRARRAPPPASPSRVASAPGPWLARIAPHASLFRRMRERGPPPGSIRPKCMLFEIKMATSSPHASISGRNRAIQDTWRANLAAKGPLSRRGTRNHARREDVASAARDFRGSGLRSGRTGFAPCGSGMRHAAWPNRLCALRRGPGLLAACAPPAVSLVPAARVHRRRLARVALRRPHRAHARRHPPRRPLRSG